MLATQVIQTCIDDLKAITKVELTVLDSTGLVVAFTGKREEFLPEEIERFAESKAECQTINGHHYLKAFHEMDVAYIVVCKDVNEDLMIAKIAVSQLENLLIAYRERIDKNNFFQNLLLDNLLLVDIYNRAKKLHLENVCRRAVILIEVSRENDNGTMEMLKNMFSPQSGDFVTSVDERTLIVIKQLDQKEGYDELDNVAAMILGMMNTEVMVNGRIAYGTIVRELKDVSKSYKEAKMALGRLIYQLPINLCKMFIEEIFGEEIPEELDEETLNTINMFLENNLNVSETARQLYVHRNTLLYRLEKLQKVTNLDIRIFDDALTLKIALMVVNYMKYLESMDY